MAYITKRVGIKRCMWGSDFPISDFLGKPISITDTFSWITGDGLRDIKTNAPLHPWRVGIEGFLAFRQTVKLLDLTSQDIEDYFYYNAQRLFHTR